MKLQKPKFSYAWLIVFVCALINFLSGFVGGYQGQWLSAVTEGRGLSRTAFSMNNSFRFATSAVMSLLFISVYQRLGAKKIFAVGPLLVNKVYDAANTYIPAIYVCMGLMAVIMVAFQVVITIANKKKKVCALT